MFILLKCYTTKGLELTRVSVVDKNLNIVYETIVKPHNEILDYNTRWSGLTKESFNNCNVRLDNVQNDLLNLFNKDTILVGHSLESDLKALKVCKKIKFFHGFIKKTLFLYFKANSQQRG